MPFDVAPLSDATFGAVVTGVRLTAISDADFADLYRAWLEHALLIFPGQHLTRDEQVAFARRFGALEFDIAPISNVRRDGSVRPDDDADGVIKILKGNMGWHCDSTYMPVQAKGAVFSAEVVPSSGGETGFADMRAAWDALDPATQARVEGLGAYHSLHYSQAKLGQSANDTGDYSGYGFHVKDPPLRPLVKTHPETGRKALMVGRHAYGIPGLAPDESERLLGELADFACRPPRVHHHAWTPGDVVVWDNRCLMHRACPWDMAEPRVMHHSRIAGDPVTEFAASA
ncbi:MAG TPA: TauD/TfdA family dioxygenase [Caulobacteraceae bacterium]|nr:TauD/TfdA family dioxygenase [Caulobacteraceae bacterium]